MAFVRSAWKILVAIKDGLALLLLLFFFGLLFAILSASPNPTSIKSGALLIDLNGTIVEEPAIIDPVAVLVRGQVPIRQYRLRDVLHAINTAADDDRIKAIVLDLNGFIGAGQVSVEQIGAALDRAKAQKKPVYVFATYYSDDSYLLAAHADEIWLDPMGGIAFAGPGGNQLYFKALLDRLNVTANVYKVGTYKSAVEPFLRNDQSPEAEAAARALYAPLWQGWQDNVAKARPQAQYADYAADPARFATAVKGDLTKLAIDLKLVDKIGDRDAFGQHIAKIAGEGDKEDPVKYAHNMLADWVAANPPETDGSPIGVVTIAGNIVDGEAGPGTAGGSRIAALLDKGLERDDLKALVVRVDSPGGSAFASEEIRRAIERYRAADIPVVISFANVAASGGYWVATAGDVIFAEPSTITGSIGIFAILPSFEKALAQYGVTADGVATTPLSGQPDVFAGPNDAVSTLLQTGIEHDYGVFLKLVADARGKTPEQIDTIAQGRVWDGGTARQLGLVDRFGSFDAALAEAAKLAKLEPDDYHPVYLTTQETGFKQFLAGFFTPSSADAPAAQTRGLVAHLAWQRQAGLAQIVRDVNMLVTANGAQAQCLECRALLPFAGGNDDGMGAAISLWTRLTRGGLEN